MVPVEQTARRARTGAMAFGALAFAFAGFTAYLVSRMIAAKGYAPERQVTVVVAVRNISAAEPVTPDMVVAARWPEQLVPPGTVANVAELSVDGKPLIAATGILAGEPVSRTRLAGSGQGTAMAALVSPGHRAIAVKVDNAITRAGLLYPGAWVDVVGTLRDPESHSFYSFTAVQHVRVLSVEAQTDVETYKRGAPTGGTRTNPVRDAVVTLEVLPEQVELIALAENQGEVDLVLRNGSDDVATETPGATPGAFAARSGGRTPSRPAAAPAAAPAPAAAAREPAARGRRRIEITAKDSPRPAERSAEKIESYHAPR